MKVKICGLTNKEDAIYAAQSGADAIGVVNVRESKRFVTLEQARQIFRAIPPFVSKVVVASPGGLDDIEKIEATGANYVQLHGEETPGYVQQIRKNTTLGLIKQIPVIDESSISVAKSYGKYADAILIDTKTKGSFGGTGQTHDWNISRKIVAEIKKPVILAGGLSAENVLDAIRKVGPYAVDVASGVEKAPGIKDKDKIKKFIFNVRRFETDTLVLADPLTKAGLLGKEEGVENIKGLVFKYKRNGRGI